MNIRRFQSDFEAICRSMTSMCSQSRKRDGDREEVSGARAKQSACEVERTQSESEHLGEGVSLHRGDPPLFLSSFLRLTLACLPLFLSHSLSVSS